MCGMWQLWFTISVLIRSVSWIINMISFASAWFRRADHHNWRISTHTKREAAVCEARREEEKRKKERETERESVALDDAHESHDRCATLRVELKRVRVGRPQADARNGRARASPCYLSARRRSAAIYGRKHDAITNVS